MVLAGRFRTFGDMALLPVCTHQHAPSHFRAWVMMQVLEPLASDMAHGVRMASTCLHLCLNPMAFQLLFEHA